MKQNNTDSLPFQTVSRQFDSGRRHTGVNVAPLTSGSDGSRGQSLFVDGGSGESINDKLALRLGFDPVSDDPSISLRFDCIESILSL